MSALKDLARLLPAPLRAPVRDVWRKFKGNPEFHLLRLLVDREQVALDIGANYGEYAVLLGRHAKACIAFEPNPALRQKIFDRAAAAGLRNVEVKTCALSNRDGEVLFRIPLVDGVESEALATIEADNTLSGVEVRSYAVPCHRLDDLDVGAVGAIKLDAEGHETAILEGARELIRQHRPTVMVEVEERHKQGSVAWVKSFFEDLGFHGYFLLGRKIVPIGDFDQHVHQSVDSIAHDEVKFGAVYANNFIYTAREDKTALLGGLARSGRAL